MVSDLGFTDDDVTVNLTDATAMVKSAMATHRPAQMATVVELTDSEDAVVQAPTKRRKSPKASTDVPNDKSLAFNKLPPWIQPRWDSGIIPTLLDMAGCHDGEDGGWEVEKDQSRFLAMIHDVIHVVYPRVRTVVLLDSIIFKRVCGLIACTTDTNILSPATGSTGRDRLAPPLPAQGAQSRQHEHGCHCR